MFLSKEKLTIQIAQVDRVEVDDMYVAKACQGQVLE
jgi:hypothetical protein